MAAAVGVGLSAGSKKRVSTAIDEYAKLYQSL